MPDYWWGVLFPPYNLLTQTTTAHSGSYAVKLHIDDLGGQPFASSLSTGNGNPVTTHPLSFVPLSVSFWYELMSVGGDELTITALVYSGGTGAGVGILPVSASANYTSVSVPIMYVTIPATADSIALIFLLTHASGTPHIGSEANIDDVSISASSGINSGSGANNFQITPNPANEFISVKFPSVANKPSEIFITDATGRLVYSSIVAANEINFNIETTRLKSGIYYCTLKSGDLENRKLFVIIHE